MNSHFVLLTVVLNSHIDLFVAICWKLMCLILSYLILWSILYLVNSHVIGRSVMTQSFYYCVGHEKWVKPCISHYEDIIRKLLSAGYMDLMIYGTISYLEFDNKRIPMCLTTLLSKKSRKTYEYVFFITL